MNDTYLLEELHSVAKRIRNHTGLFDGTPRRFLREGDLIKYTRTGRRISYRWVMGLATAVVVCFEMFCVLFFFTFVMSPLKKKKIVFFLFSFLAA